MGRAAKKPAAAPTMKAMKAMKSMKKPAASKASSTKCWTHAVFGGARLYKPLVTRTFYILECIRDGGRSDLGSFNDYLEKMLTKNYPLALHVVLAMMGLTDEYLAQNGYDGFD